MEEPLTITQLDRTVTEWIEQEARRTGQPIEAIARRLIYRGLEVERQQARQQRHHDLDALAGTWSAEEADEFGQAIADLNQIDPNSMAVSAILLDTNAYIAFKQGQPDAVEIIRWAARLAFSSTVLGELLAGFAIGSREAKNRAELQQFLASARVHILIVDDGTATYYATIYRNLRNKGRPIPTNDMWIAASALQHGYALFSYDAHFQAVDGLLIGATPTDFPLS